MVVSNSEVERIRYWYMGHTKKMQCGDLKQDMKMFGLSREDYRPGTSGETITGHPVNHVHVECSHQDGDFVIKLVIVCRIDAEMQIMFVIILLCIRKDVYKWSF